MVARTNSNDKAERMKANALSKQKSIEVKQEMRVDIQELSLQISEKLKESEIEPIHIIIDKYNVIITLNEAGEPVLIDGPMVLTYADFDEDESLLEELLDIHRFNTDSRKEHYLSYTQIGVGEKYSTISITYTIPTADETNYSSVDTAEVDGFFIFKKLDDINNTAQIIEEVIKNYKFKSNYDTVQL